MLGTTQGGEHFSKAVGIGAHEYGHLILGDAWVGCDHYSWTGQHLQTLDGFAVMDGNQRRRATMMSAYYRYAAGWDTATVITETTDSLQIAPFRTWNDRGDLYVLPIDTITMGTVCGQQDLLEFFLVENRQRASFWEDPDSHWTDLGDPDSLFPCKYGVDGTVDENPRRLPGTGLAIYHVFETRTGEDSEIENSLQTIIKRVDVEVPTGRFDVENLPVGWRVIQDQKPLPIGPDGWDRLDIKPNQGDDMGIWEARHFWNSADSTGSTFAPYTNPGSGEYKPKAFGGLNRGQDAPSGAGIINIGEKGLSDTMIADFIVGYPPSVSPSDTLPSDSLHVNTTWSGIVRLDDTLYVGPGETLTIKPRTTVVVTPNKDIQIRVTGTLIATGTPTDSIFFTTAYDSARLGTPSYAADSSAAAGQWTGIVARTGATVRLDYCDIRYATRGVDLKSGASNSSWIKHSTFRDCSEYGVYVKRTDSMAITYNLIDTCGINGIWAGNCSSLTITRNVVQRNESWILIDRCEARIDTNIVRMNGSTDLLLGHQLEVIGPGGNVIEIVRNFFGGDRTTVCTSAPPRDTCWVQKGIIFNESAAGPGDTLLIRSNTFKYIDQTGLEVILREPPLFVGETRSVIDVGGPTTVIGGNEFFHVNLVYDMSGGWNTVVSGTAAQFFEVGIRSDNTRCVFGDTSTSLGQLNYFVLEHPDSLPDAFINVTQDTAVSTFFAQGCYWNGGGYDYWVQNHPELFKVGQDGLPNEISIEPHLVSLPFRFPWDFWENLKKPAARPLSREEEDEAADHPTALVPPSPNPFQGSITIRLTLARSVASNSTSQIAIYDITGREIRTFALSQGQPGERSVTWDGRDSKGNEVSSGVYFARLEAGDQKFTKRVVLVR